jgi:hypothetical protein
MAVHVPWLPQRYAKLCFCNSENYRRCSDYQRWTYYHGSTRKWVHVVA